MARISATTMPIRPLYSSVTTIAAKGIGTSSGRPGNARLSPAVSSSTSEKSAPKKTTSRSLPYVWGR